MFDLLNKISIPLGRWFGTEVVIHWTMTIAIVLVGIFNPHYLATLGCVFGIVLLHEFGHVLAGQRVGLFSQAIYLTPLGGVALFPATRPNAKDEFIMTIGGPLVNVALIPVLWAMTFVSPFWTFIATCNLVLLIFNLLPSFPMDGGRLLRAGYFYWTGDYLAATRIAVITSKVICVIMGTLGAMTMNFGMVMIAFLIFQMADAEQAQAAAKLDYFGGSLSLPEGSTPHNEEAEQSARNLQALRRKIRNINR